MTLLRISRPLLAALSLTVFLLIGNAQVTRTNFNRERDYDVQNYTIRVSFDREKKTVFGDTTVDLKPLKSGFTRASLDAVGLSFESVRLEPSGTDLKFNSADGKVVVSMDKAYGPNDLLSLRFKYSAVPSKGVYFIEENHIAPDNIQAAQIWTQGEAEEARHWFPSFDHPSDKATSETFITAQKGETVIGNGELVEWNDNADGTVTYHYKMTVPYSTYLTSFVIGKYVLVSDKHGKIPLGFYVYPGKEAIAPIAFGRTKDMMQAFEELTGVPFPYNKYDQTIVRNFHFGGMENITATTLADTEVFFANFDFGKATVQDLVSHELAHSWFGDMVTCRNWSELWLNEGFATFMEAAAREKLYGRDSYMNKVRSDAEQFLADDETNRRRHGLVNMIAKADDSLFDTTTYQKGGAVLHTLREQVGTENFWKGVNIYLNRHKFDNVESSDLRAAMEEVSGQDLKWFFDQWIYAGGSPKLDVRQSYNPRTRTYTITINQVQKLDRLTPPAFRLPMDVEFTVAGKLRSEHIDVTTRSSSFTFKAAARPNGLRLDRDEKIILKSVKIAPLAR